MFLTEHTGLRGMIMTDFSSSQSISIALDYQLSKKEQKELLNLLIDSFPGYFANRLYYKNVPTFRLLAKQDNQIIAQVGIDCRVINSRNNGPLQIFGIVDLCVSKDFQQKGIGTQFLKTLEDSATKGEIDALVLFADDHRLYQKAGFQNELVTCRFLAVEELSSICVLEKDRGDCFMVKPIRENLDFKKDQIDMLGHIF